MPDSQDDLTLVLVDDCDTQDLPPRIGKFTIIRMLGKGGMGTVYLGKDPMLDRLAAIKTLHAPPPSMSHENRRQLVQRFLREAKSLAKINHNNIIKVYAIGRHENTLYIAMEYVEGQTLMELCKSPVELPLQTKLQYMIQMCEGLDVIHESGLVHRDIKPTNIMVTHQGVIKIMDFGTVHTQDSELTRTEQIIGTPSYMSPEQVGGIRGTLQSDIFSLGAVFYLFLTGEKAFSGETFSSVAYKITHSAPAPPSKINPLLPVQLDEIIENCMNKTPEHRFQNCQEIITALRELQLGSSVRSQNARRSSMIRKSALTAALVLLAVFGGLALLRYGPSPGQPPVSQQDKPAATGQPQNATPANLSFQLNYFFQPDGSESIRKLRNNEELNPRDTYKICFTPDQDCYVYIFTIVNELYVNQLFPSSGFLTKAENLNNPVTKGRTYVLPSRTTPYVLGPKETVSIYFMASNTRNTELERKYSLLHTTVNYGNKKFEIINRYILRKILRKSARNITPVTAKEQIALSWNAQSKEYSFPLLKVNNLCDGCSTVITFLNSRRTMDNWRR